MKTLLILATSPIFPKPCTVNALVNSSCMARAARPRNTPSESTRTAGADIIPVSVDNAREWVEDHLDAEDYEKIFGAVSEDEEDILLTFKAPAALDRKLSDKAAELGISKSELLRQLIEKME